MAFLLSMVLVLIRIRTMPHLIIRLMKGTAGFGLGFTLVYLPVSYFGVGFGSEPSQEIMKTEREYMRVPYSIAEQVAGEELPPNNVYAFFGWNLIMPVTSHSELEQGVHYWLHKKEIEIQEPKITGVWRRANLSMEKPGAFYFRLLDLCAICLGVLGFLSGALNFSIKPR
jgi:hypothetical protein